MGDQFGTNGRGPHSQTPALLVLHSFPSASWDWHAIWRHLTARFRVIAPDFLGFGWSDKPPAYDHSVMDQASLCEGLLQSLDLTRVHVLAHDYGDTVAQELLARHGLGGHPDAQRLAKPADTERPRAVLQAGAKDR